MRALQIVFQNPDSALNRRHSVRKIMRRSLKKLTGMTGAAAEARTLELMDSVRLAERYVSAQPGQLSGGLKQRLAIARSFAGNPKLVVCDEPTSALDVSVQAAILNLLVELQAEQRVSYLFISHDLGVVRYVSDRIAVLYLGRLMELGLSEAVFDGPHHPYTEALLSAVPNVDGGERPRIKLDGRHSERREPAQRLRVPHALPAEGRPDLRRAGAAADRGRATATSCAATSRSTSCVRCRQRDHRSRRRPPLREDPRRRTRGDGRAVPPPGARPRTARAR